MALVEPIFFDTSILLSGLIEIDDGDAPAQAILSAVSDRRIRSPHTAWHCCLEFFAVSTRLPEDLRLSPPDALRLLEEEVLARFRVHQLPEKSWQRLLDSVRHERVAGGRIYDVHIAEIALLTGAKVVATDNRRHFTSLLRHGTRVLSAAELAEIL